MRPVLSLFLSTLLAAPTFAAPLPPLGEIKPAELALWVAPADGGEAVFSHRAETAVNPASTMKLITTVAALEKLGPDFRWKTELLTDGSVIDGHLRGNLYWRGNGDPALDRDGLADLLRQLRQRGIRQIDGELRLDKSAFNNLGSAGQLDPDDSRAYQTPPDPLLLNLKVVWLSLFNTPAGVKVASDPPLAGIKLDNRLRPVAGDCSGGIKRYASLALDGDTLHLSGTLPAGCDGARLYAPVFGHERFQAEAFAALWQETGGSWTGSARPGLTPPEATVLARHDSPPLAQVIGDINRYSNNTMARQLFLTLGAQTPSSGDTVRDAELAVRGALAEMGLDNGALVLENGSGLSRRERVSAGLLGRMLQRAARQSFYPELAASLPRPGSDGTLKRRFGDVAAHLRLKTGTLNDVRALAGYLDIDGRPYVLVAVVNSPRAPDLLPALDRLVARIADDIGRTQLAARR